MAKEAQKKLMESMKDQLEVQVVERTSELTKQKEELSIDNPVFIIYRVKQIISMR